MDAVLVHGIHPVIQDRTREVKGLDDLDACLEGGLKSALVLAPLLGTFFSFAKMVATEADVHFFSLA